MKYSEFAHLVKELKYHDTIQQEYLLSTTVMLHDFIVENEYASNTSKLNDYLLTVLLGDMYEDVMWFVYECQETPTKPNVTVEGREYTIHSIESYLNYALIELFNNDNS